MELDVSQVDVKWQSQHCRMLGGEASSSKQGAGGPAEGGRCSVEKGACEEGLSDTVNGNATALHCDFGKAVGVVPIPVVRTKHLPEQVKQLLQAAQEAFAASKQISAA